MISTIKGRRGYPKKIILCTLNWFVFCCCLKIVLAKDFFSHVKARQNYLQHSLLHPPPPRTHQTIIIIIGYKDLSDVYYFINNHLATGVIIVIQRDVPRNQSDTGNTDGKRLDAICTTSLLYVRFIVRYNIIYCNTVIGFCTTEAIGEYILLLFR